MQTEKVLLMDAALFTSSVEMAGAELVSARWEGRTLMSVDLSISRQATDSVGYVVGTETFLFSFRAFPKEILGIPKNSLVEERYPLSSHAVLFDPSSAGISMDHPEPEGDGYFPPDEDFAFQELEGFIGGVSWQRFEFLVDGDPDDPEWAGRRCWLMVTESQEKDNTMEESDKIESDVKMSTKPPVENSLTGKQRDALRALAGRYGVAVDWGGVAVGGIGLSAGWAHCRVGPIVVGVSPGGDVHS